ncbi:hypothetical protein [Clostridium thermosuccinogenes]|jgi:hypothetical protein|uniref:hypothetical protein n=1 Tax=Clostridium thermosuccinogenes TaxID=84032 RepID=UPI000CCC5E52|nr:hypothetical protein [Pseudoclostridium thermosuccinogenes]PNT90663.1 hypothetical protein CDQ83_18690 [Pseudoclostridium thermosuccinogenes]
MEQFTMYEREEVECSGSFSKLLGCKVTVISDDEDDYVTDAYIADVSGEKLVVKGTHKCYGEEWEYCVAHSINDPEIIIYKSKI